MISLERTAQIQYPLSKNERQTVTTPPKDAILAEVLRDLEVQLQKRGLLREPPSTSFFPIWFLAETERNVFLWRSGHSLANQDSFEFWIDIWALIHKRLNQLDSYNSENPFLNPLWGHTVQDLGSSQREKDYLLSFLDILGKVEAHAEALSHVACLVRRELFDQGNTKELVVLPVTKKYDSEPTPTNS